MTRDQVLSALRAAADPARAEGLSKHHRTASMVMGTGNAVLADLGAQIRANLDVAARVALARELWATQIHEARIVATQALKQARLRPDDDAWAAMVDWVAEVDCAPVADHLIRAGQKRVLADPTRLDTVAEWAAGEALWPRVIALGLGQAWTGMKFPKDADLTHRARVVEMTIAALPDHRRPVQGAVTDVLTDLAKVDPDTVRDILSTHGDAMAGAVRKSLLRALPA